jgi:hypothetical protein
MPHIHTRHITGSILYSSHTRSFRFFPTLNPILNRLFMLFQHQMLPGGEKVQDSPHLIITNVARCDMSPRLALTGHFRVTLCGSDTYEPWSSESIELFIEGQVFLLSNDLAPAPPLPSISRQQVVSLAKSSCVSPVELTDMRREREWGKSLIIRRRESLVLY